MGSSLSHGSVGPLVWGPCTRMSIAYLSEDEQREAREANRADTLVPPEKLARLEAIKRAVCPPSPRQRESGAEIARARAYWAGVTAGAVPDAISELKSSGVASGLSPDELARLRSGSVTIEEVQSLIERHFRLMGWVG